MSDITGAKHLVIPDAHAKPGQNLRRFDWLGQLIIQERPDVVICIGDLGDMPSLSSYDRGTKGFEGRRYNLDCESVHEAQRRMRAPLDNLNARYRANRKKQYHPRFVMCLGNHENRINRVINADAVLDGTISMADLHYEDYGWEVHKFLDEVLIDGVSYSHFFVSGVMARPIGGENPATMLLNKRHKSCTAGHLHLADWSVRTEAGGKHIMGMLVGCYVEDDEEYVPKSVNQMWWKGVVIKRNVIDGIYDPEFLSMFSIKRLAAHYGWPEGGSSEA